MRTASIVMFVLILLALLPIASGEAPKEVEGYCAGFSLEECTDHYSWFSIEACKSLIKCVGDVDMDTLEYRGCGTVLKDVFDDCESHPSTLCYNGVAYDTSVSETCGDGAGARFRTVDSCGNPKGTGACLKLSTCEEKVMRPYTGTAITVHEGCEVLDGNATISPAREEEQEEPRTSSSSTPKDGESQHGEDIAEETAAETPKQEIQTGASAPTGVAEIVPQASPSAKASLPPKRQPPVLAGVLLALGIVGVGIIIYWYIWHRR